MPRSREGGSSKRPWRRRLSAVPLALLAVAPLSVAAVSSGTWGASVAPAVAPTDQSPTPSVTISLTPTPTPTSEVTPTPTPTPEPTPTPTPTPTAAPTPTATPTATPPVTGELQITKVDANNQPIAALGFTFNIRVGSSSGQVIATISTDASSTAVAAALNPATYCVEEIAAAAGYQVAPSYSPASCVAVASDPTQGRNPTTVTVTDATAATPAPAAVVPSAAAPSPSAPPRAAARPAPARPPSLPVAALARGLIGLGALLLAAGAVLIAVAVRRRRRPPPEPPADLPPDYRYDSTIT